MMNYIYTLIPIALLIFAAVQGSKWNFNAATYMDKKYSNGNNYSIRHGYVTEDGGWYFVQTAVDRWSLNDCRMERKKVKRSAITSARQDRLTISASAIRFRKNC